MPSSPADSLDFLLRTRFKPFPLDALPKGFRRFVDACHEAIGCDPTYIILPLLSAAAAAIGNTRRIVLKQGWTEPSILWTCIVGQSGSMKSPALRAALGPLNDRQARELSRWQADHGGVRHGRRDRKENGPTAEPPSRLLCRDATIDAVLERLADNPRGLLLARDELTGFVGGIGEFKKWRNGDLARWIETYEGGSVIIDRKSSDHPTLHIPMASVSITGGIQQDMFLRAFGSDDFESGLVARFQCSMPPHRVAGWTDAELSSIEIDELDRVFEELLGIELQMRDAGPRPVEVHLSATARLLWIDFVNEMAQEQALVEGRLAFAIGKLKGVAARLALVIHEVRLRTGEGRFNQNEIDEVSVEMATEIARWFKSETERIYRIIGESEHHAKVRRSIELIQRHKGTITANQLRRYSARHSSKEEAEAALQELAAMGAGEFRTRTSTDRGGRPTVEFVLSHRWHLRNYETPSTAPSGGWIEGPDGEQAATA